MTMTTHLPTPLQTKMHLCSKQNHLTFFIPAEKSFVCLINLMMMLNGRGGGGHRDLQLAHFWWELVGNGEMRDRKRYFCWWMNAKQKNARDQFQLCVCGCGYI
jgi:hypothetical protein